MADETTKPGAAHAESTHAAAPPPFVIPRVVDGKLALFNKDGSRASARDATREDFVALGARTPAPAPQAWDGVSYYVKLGDKKFPPKWSVRAVFELADDGPRLPLGGHVAAALRELGLEAGRRGMPWKPRRERAAKGAPQAAAPTETEDEGEG